MLMRAVRPVKSSFRERSKKMTLSEKMYLALDFCVEILFWPIGSFNNYRCFRTLYRKNKSAQNLAHLQLFRLSTIIGLMSVAVLLGLILSRHPLASNSKYLEIFNVMPWEVQIVMHVLLYVCGWGLYVIAHKLPQLMYLTRE